MKKKVQILILAALLMAVGAGGYAFRNIGVSDAAIRTKFECDRTTKEIRQTDYYCQNPGAYRMGKAVPQSNY